MTSPTSHPFWRLVRTGANLKKSCLAILGCAAAIVATTSATAQQTPLSDPIGRDGWVWAARLGETAVLTRPAVQVAQSPFRRIWVRFETPRHGAPAVGDREANPPVSSVGLYEVGCTMLRNKQLSLVAYSEPNMSGAVIYQTAHEGKWTYAAPGSLEEGFSRAACAQTAALQ